MSQSDEPSNWQIGPGMADRDHHAPPVDDHRDGGRPQPWFWAVAALTFLFELTGCLAWYRELAGDPGLLSAGQRALALATPTWVNAAFAVAVGVGLLGAVMLMFRRKEASIALFVSLTAVAVQMSGGLMMPATLNQFNLGQIVPPVAVFALSYLVWQLSLIARNRGWLR